MAIDLYKSYVGEYIEFFDILGSEVGGTDVFIAPSVAYDNVTGLTSSYVFNGNTYIPTPAKITGIRNDSTGAPPTPVLTVSNLNKILYYQLLQHSGLYGATVIRHRTFVDYIASGDEFQPDVFVISQLSKFNRKEAQLKLNTPIDQEGVKLPFRQILKDGGFPGVSRNGTR